MIDEKWEAKNVGLIEKQFLASQEDRNKRIEICEACEHLHRWKYCKLCWCYMPLKTHINNSSCPMGKWGPV
jgi:hypothetical protein